MLRHALFGLLALSPVPAAAQRLSPVPPLPALAPALSADAALDRFYAARPAKPLWIDGGQLTTAGSLLLARLRTADIDGLADGPELARRIDTAMAAPATDRMAIDRMLSAGWIYLVSTLHGPIAGARYVDQSLRPQVELPDRTMYLAGQATDLGGHVSATLRKSNFYEQLRSAALVDVAANGGRADPRLIANLQRARILPSRGRYLFVNPATAQLMMVNDGQIEDRMRVVVGTIQTPTAPMVSKVSFAILNPYWNVAEDLVRKIVAPRVVSGGMAYLARANYEAIDKYGDGATVIPARSIDWKAVVAGTTAVKMRQLPGKLNSMGQMKFPFPNELGLFLHDTPNKPQFSKAARALSNGCIRLEDAPRLARWLFGADPVAAGSTPDQVMRLPTGVPLYVVYLTAQPVSGSTIDWARDVYALDPPATRTASAI